ncbi:collagen-like triple helix repeat-containing protein, partial [Methylophaga thiooxydans]|uniref:collagen-like triple helix repeat-containing protein n=1 Tax=Methylophaga thiooxydans TaxID=392484 RepID=UPI002352CA0E
MEKKKLTQHMILALALSMSVGCSGSSSKSVKSSSDSDMVEGGGGASATAIEKVVADTGDTGEGVATTVRTLGATVSQVDLLGTGEVTSGTGEIITNVGDGVGSLATGLKDGLGALSENDNAIGTTLAGVTGTVFETGEAVSAAGNTIGSLNTLPVFSQIDEATGLLTELDGTVSSLGATVTEIGGVLSVSFEEGALSGTTTDLTAVVRPLVTNVGGITQSLGDALVVGPVGGKLLSELGTAVVVLGNHISDDENAVLAGVGGTVVGAGQLVIDAGGVISVAEPGQ